MCRPYNQLPHQTTLYQIRLKGHLGRQWADWFDGFTITLEENGRTQLIGPAADQAALHGLLKKIRDLGMPLLSLNCLEADNTTGDTTMNRDTFLIEADELMTKLNDPNVRIFDATIAFFRKDTDPTAYDDYVEAHIPGAAFFDHQAFSDSTNKYMYMVLPEDELMAQIGRKGISADSEVIVYTGNLLPCATRAWWVLTYAGHPNVRLLNGGIEAWKAAGGQIEQGENQYKPTTFNSQIHPEMFATKEDVLASLENGNVCVVNTLSDDSYQQAHITGSSLLPCIDLMHEMAAFRSTEELAARLHDEAQQHGRIITYCGGGIAATTNAMAHRIIGNKNVAVYDGSMDEWGGEKLPITAA